MECPTRAPTLFDAGSEERMQHLPQQPNGFVPGTCPLISAEQTAKPTQNFALHARERSSVEASDFSNRHDGVTLSVQRWRRKVPANIPEDIKARSNGLWVISCQWF